MLAKTSKRSSDQTKSGRSLLSVLSVEGPHVAGLLFDLVSPHRQETDPEPDFQATFIALGRTLRGAIDRVVSADRLLFAANTALDAARQNREASKLGLNRQIISLRGACNALFVDLTVQELGFDERTFQDPAPLLMQADRIVEHLRGDEFARAEYVFEGDDFDPKKYADRIEASSGDLRDSLDEVAEANRQTQARAREKRALADEYDGVYLHGARVFESYCRLVGEDEIADRVRPATPQPARTEPEPDVPPEEPPEETQPDESPPDEGPEPGADQEPPEPAAESEAAAP